MNKDTITKCPVCENKRIIQDYENTVTIKNNEFSYEKNGSHCEICGTRFAFNKGVINKQANR